MVVGASLNSLGRSILQGRSAVVSKNRVLVFRTVAWLTYEPPLAGPPPIREREEHGAASLLGEALRRPALDTVGAHAANTAFHEARPHPVVNAVGFSALDDERSKRAGRAFEPRRGAVQRFQRGVKAERPERLAHSRQARTKVARRLQARCCSEAAAEILARFPERTRSGTRGNPAHEQTDQLREPPIRELHGLELGGDGVDVRRPSSSGAAAPASARARDSQEPGLGQAIEATPRDVPVDAEYDGDLLDRERLLPAARVEQDASKLRIAGRRKAVERRRRALERHGARTVPRRAARGSVGCTRDPTHGGST